MSSYWDYTHRNSYITKKKPLLTQSSRTSLKLKLTDIDNNSGQNRCPWRYFHKTSDLKISMITGAITFFVITNIYQYEMERRWVWGRFFLSKSWISMIISFEIFPSNLCIFFFGNCNFRLSIPISVVEWIQLRDLFIFGWMPTGPCISALCVLRRNSSFNNNTWKKNSIEPDTIKNLYSKAQRFCFRKVAIAAKSFSCSNKIFRKCRSNCRPWFTLKNYTPF